MIDTLLFDLDGHCATGRRGSPAPSPSSCPRRPRWCPRSCAATLIRASGARSTSSSSDRRDGRVVERRHYWIDIDPMPVWRAVLPEVPQRPLDAADRALPRTARRRPLCRRLPRTRAAARALHAGGAHQRADAGVRAAAHGLRALLRRRSDGVGGTKKPAAAAFERGPRCPRSGRRDDGHVGDSLIADVQGALSAGLTAVWIDRFGDGNPLPEGAHRIEALTELPALLVSLAEGAD